MATPLRKFDVSVGPRRLGAALHIPDRARGLIVFAHGSGSSRFSPRNTFVAAELVARGFATLLMDLLTEREALDRRNVFDIPLLGERLVEALDWAAEPPDTSGLPIGLFGASTGAAAALVAAAQRPKLVRAVVSRGGRPDLAERVLSKVQAPTLLIVGSLHDDVLALNRAALRRLSVEARLAVVPGATHLFEEPYALEQVVEAAAEWFARHLPAREAATRGERDA